MRVILGIRIKREEAEAAVSNRENNQKTQRSS